LYLTTYAKSKGSWIENFAEAFAHFVLGMALPPEILAIMNDL
jgi:hypothetical protein